jgi:hypothetical protein
MMWFPDAAENPTLFESLRRQVQNGRYRSFQLVGGATIVWCIGVALTGVGLALALLSYGPGTATNIAAAVAFTTGLGVALFTVAAANHLTDLGNEPPPPPLGERRHAELFGRDVVDPQILTEVAVARGVGDLYIEAGSLLGTRCALTVRGATLVAHTVGGDVVKLHPAVSEPGRLLVSFELAALAHLRDLDVTDLADELAASDAARRFGAHFTAVTNVGQIRTALGLP